jgi:UDP-N-acetylmuramate dehydrogenase
MIFTVYLLNNTGMQVQENIPLQPYNTFGIDAYAQYFVRIASRDDLLRVLNLQQFRTLPRLILGGGSNVLLTKNFEGLVLRNEIPGIQKINEDDDYVYVRCGAGENWHRFVLHCISNAWAGLENLSLIPGCTGASPMQNIGAYGVEIRDHFHELTAFHLGEQANYIFKAKDCGFGYRESVFKHKYKGQFMIMDVTFRLDKRPHFNTNYGAIEQELERMGVKELSIAAISQAVINIRSSKLPDPREIGNAGSFFKNPSISKESFSNLKVEFPGIVAYDNPDGSVKLAAGWLIEQCGWKGFRKGDAGVHARQALVLVNYGNARGSELLALSEDIMQSVKAKFGVDLEREVNII